MRHASTCLLGCAEMMSDLRISPTPSWLGHQWDVAYERLEQEWRAAYTAALVEIAVSRGWRREDAGTWPVGIGDEAFIEVYPYDWDPWRAAAADVVACEAPP